MLKEKLIGDKRFYKKVLLIALPIMLQNGLTNLVSMVDNIMVGSIGTEQMSAVAIVNQLLFVFNLAIFGITGGIGIFTAQYFGKDDKEGIKNTLRLKLVSSIILLGVAIGIFVFLGPILINAYLHDGTMELDLALAFSQAKQYLSIMLIGLIPFTISQVYGGTLREVEKPALPMSASIIAVGVNLIFNYLLIFGNLGFPRLGVCGAAIATVISRFAECLVIIAFAKTNKDAKVCFSDIYKNFRIPKELTLRILPKALPLLINEFFWSLGSALLNWCYSLRGLDVVAAININSTVANLFNVSTIAFGSAISIIVGGLLGAKKIEEAKKTNVKLTFTSFVICLFLSLVLVAISPFFPKIYNTQSNVKELASAFICCYALYLPMNSLINSFYFAMRSGGETFITLLFDSVYMFVITVPFTFALANFTSLHIIAVYALSLAIEVFKLILGFILIRRGKWAKSIVEEAV